MVTAGFIVAVAILDAILVALMEETDYELEQFSFIHPSGAVGKRLNI